MCSSNLQLAACLCFYIVVQYKSTLALSHVRHSIVQVTRYRQKMQYPRFQQPPIAAFSVDAWVIQSRLDWLHVHPICTGKAYDHLVELSQEQPEMFCELTAGSPDPTDETPCNNVVSSILIRNAISINHTHNGKINAMACIYAIQSIRVPNRFATVKTFDSFDLMMDNLLFISENKRIKYRSKITKLIHDEIQTIPNGNPSAIGVFENYLDIEKEFNKNDHLPGGRNPADICFETYHTLVNVYDYPLVGLDRVQIT